MWCHISDTDQHDVCDTTTMWKWWRKKTNEFSNTVQLCNEMNSDELWPAVSLGFHRNRSMLELVRRTCFNKSEQETEQTIVGQQKNVRQSTTHSVHYLKSYLTYSLISPAQLFHVCSHCWFSVFRDFLCRFFPCVQNLPLYFHSQHKNISNILTNHTREEMTLTFLHVSSNL